MKATLIPKWLIEFEKEAGYTVEKRGWLQYSVYKKLWSIIGGRPWTFITRDIWHQFEYIMQMAWFFIGIGIYIWIGWFGVLLFIIFYTLGYINGHFFWGKKYMPWQKGE